MSHQTFLQAGAYADDRVAVNTAGLTELTVLPGIGEKKARAIIEYREANGPFRALSDLLKVPGIGPKTLEGLAGLIRFSQGEPAQ
jgi:competence protein ComEA